MNGPSEREIRENVKRWTVGRTRETLPWTQKRFAYLLDLLDTQRSETAAAWDHGLVNGIAYVTRVQRDPDTWEPSNPHRKSEVAS